MIVDAHHHLWLFGQVITRGSNRRRSRPIFGDYRAIRRDYTVADFRADAAAAGLVRAGRDRRQDCPAERVLGEPKRMKAMASAEAESARQACGVSP
jgi:hypothetical protein